MLIFIIYFPTIVIVLRQFASYLQVNEKERERIAERQKMFEEGLAIRSQIAMRKKTLQDAMERKCQEMREHKVPDMYINEVKRMIENI